MRREHVLLFLSTPRPWMSKRQSLRVFSSTRRRSVNLTLELAVCACVLLYVPVLYVCVGVWVSQIMVYISMYCISVEL